MTDDQKALWAASGRSPPDEMILAAAEAYVFVLDLFVRNTLIPAAGGRRDIVNAVMRCDTSKLPELQKAIAELRK